jgi:GntR family transcriptional regulator
VETRFTPRYFVIEQALRERIVTMSPGDPLPSDAMLCREFSVSRMTARNAVQRLAQEGLVDRVPGRGTFVAEPPAHRQVDNLLSFSEQMRRRGQAASSDHVDVEVRPATDEEAKRLELADGGDVVVLRRLRLADRVPVADEIAVLPGRFAAAIEGVDWQTASLHELLVAAGVVPRAGRATITAQSATATDARRLKVRRNAALLVERRLVVDGGGRPVELTESRYAAGRYGLDVRFSVEPPAGA